MTLRRRIQTVQSFLKQRRDALRFDAIPEPRRRRGRRWGAATLLTTAVLSLMLLARSLRQAERLSRDLADARRVKGLRRRLPDSTLGDFVARLAPAPLRRQLHARLIDADSRAYWMALKGTQPELLAAARRVLLPQSYREAPEAQTHWERDSSRGWIKRELWRTGPVAPWSKWTHLRQVVLIRVWQAAGCQHGKAPVYGPPRILEERWHVTNLVRGRLNGDQLLALDRAHWRIENNLHGTLDIQWQEDHGRGVRRGRGLPVSALLRVLAYNLLELLRAVHLRSAEARAAAWTQLRDWVRDALVWPDLTAGDAEDTPGVT